MYSSPQLMDAILVLILNIDRCIIVNLYYLVIFFYLISDYIGQSMNHHIPSLFIE